MRRRNVLYVSKVAVGGLLALVAAGSWSAASAQTATGAIVGAVTDETPAALPGVAISVINSETGIERTTVTNSIGAFRVPQLLPGEYVLRAELAGFRPFVQPNLRVTVGGEMNLNIQLAIGELVDEIVVTGEAGLVNTTSGSLSGFVSEDRIEHLPLNGRNYVTLAFLQTGVSQSRNTTVSPDSSASAFSAQGAPIRSNLFMIDGTIMNDSNDLGAASTNNTTLGVEGIREFRVVTNSFSAEYGTRMGSQITLVTKGGTNRVHGSALYFVRDSAMDARNWEDRAEKPDFSRHNFGGSLGGPLARDRAFFFFTYEGLRQERGTTEITSVPTAEARLDGGLVPRISAAARPFLERIPLPNGRALGGGLGEYTGVLAQEERQNYVQGRVDYNFSKSNSLFVRYTRDPARRVSPTLNPEVTTIWQSRNQYLTVSGNQIFSPTLLNTVRFSFSRTNTFADRTAMQAPELEFAFFPGQGVGGITITGMGYPLGEGSGNESHTQRIVGVSDDVFYTRGRHSIKFGALVNMYRQNPVSGADGSRPSWRFSNLRDFMEGIPNRLRILTPGSIVSRKYDFATVGFYFQNDLRATSNLTLNLGLRYEFATQIEEADGYGAALRDIVNDADTTIGIPFKNPSRGNVSPRLGFAWDILGDGTTALRGGAGLPLYDLGGIGQVLRSSIGGNPPTSSRSNLSPSNLPGLTFGPLPVIPPALFGRDLGAVDFDLEQPKLYSFNVTLERQLPWSSAVAVSYAGSRGVNILMRGEGNPTVPQILADGRPFWTGREPRVNPNWGTIELTHASSKSWYDSMQVSVTKRATRGLQVESAYTLGEAVDLTQGLRGADDSGTRTEGDYPQDPTFDKGASFFDVRHNWNVNATYELPGPAAGPLAAVIGGWSVSGIFRWSSGLPFSPSSSRERSRANVLGGTHMNRIDLVSGVDTSTITSGESRGCPGLAAGTPVGTTERWFDPCAFALQPLGFLGNAPRSSVRGPAFREVDLSFMKRTRFPLGDQGALQFRIDIFNLFNRPNFGVPDGIVYDGRADVEPVLPTVGRFTSTVNRSRQVQLGFRVIW
jgi:hypothetical protein